MKRGCIFFLIALLALLGIKNVCACIITNNNQMGVVFPYDAKVNMDVLEGYCSKKADFCKIMNENLGPKYYKEISFKLIYQKQEMIMVARSSKENETTPEINSLAIKFVSKNPDTEELISFVMRALASNNLLSGLSGKDIESISNVSIMGALTYFKPENCKNSYRFTRIDNTDEYEQGWLLGGRNCIVNDFIDKCPKIGCYECEMDISLENLKIVPLILKNPPLENLDELSNDNYEITEEADIPKEKNQIIIYLIIGILIAMAIITLIIIILYKKK